MMNFRRSIFVLLLALFVLGGCATLPAGPSVTVMPAPGKPFEQFQADDVFCRQWAGQQIGVQPQETLNQNAAAGAAIGTAVGAGIGAAIGSVSGHMGSGAAIGAGTGLLAGTASGINTGRVYGWEAQRRYDIAYQQCMYTKGNQVPGAIQRSRHIQQMPPPPPPGPWVAPPPPSGQ